MKKRYAIAIPADARTGGPEALHQLCATMRELRMDASVVHFGTRNDQIVSAYHAAYGNPEFGGPPDAEAVLIVPETEDPTLWKARGWGVVCVWWLAATRTFPLDRYVGVHHCFQSFHAREQCGMFGVRGAMLTDYLGDVHRFAHADSEKKTDAILLNHRSAHWLRPLSKALSDVEFQLLAGMPPEQVTQALLRGRVYVDLGSHPGRDRMPREAALANCIVIVGNFGSAAGADVPIPAEFKLTSTTVEIAARAIRSALTGYPEKLAAFGGYRKWICGQQDDFRREVAQLDTLFSAPPASVPFEQREMDAAWVALQVEMHSLRGALSRTAILEAILLQAATFKKSAWGYLATKALTSVKRKFSGQ